MAYQLKHWLPELRVRDILFTKEQIADRVQEIASEIDVHLQNVQEEVVLLCVLNGAMPFCVDLSRAMNRPHTVQTISASSYLGGTESSGHVTVSGNVNLRGKHVIVVEDILDTGLTLSKLLPKLRQEQEPVALEVAVLLSKPTELKHEDVLKNVKWVGFQLEPPRFVVGYGLDYCEYLRGLPYIAEAAVVQE